MADPVKGVDGTQGATAGGRYSGGSFSEDRKKRGASLPQKDLIEISQDARERSGSRKKKSLFEYLKELFG